MLFDRYCPMQLWRCDGSVLFHKKKIDKKCLVRALNFLQKLKRKNDMKNEEKKGDEEKEQEEIREKCAS